MQRLPRLCSPSPASRTFCVSTGWLETETGLTHGAPAMSVPSAGRAVPREARGASPPRTATNERRNLADSNLRGGGLVFIWWLKPPSFPLHLSMILLFPLNLSARPGVAHHITPRRFQSGFPRSANSTIANFAGLAGLLRTPTPSGWRATLILEKKKRRSEAPHAPLPCVLLSMFRKTWNKLRSYLLKYGNTGLKAEAEAWHCQALGRPPRPFFALSIMGPYPWKTLSWFPFGAYFWPRTKKAYTIGGGLAETVMASPVPVPAAWPCYE